MKKRPLAWDNLIYAVVFVIICAVCILIWHYRDSKDESEKIARIIKDGELIREINLSEISEPYAFEISGELGRNTIRAEHNRIAVTDADCPDKICVNQGYIDNGTVPIVCLPHKLSVEISDSENSVDAVVGR